MPFQIFSFAAFVVTAAILLSSIIETYWLACLYLLLGKHLLDMLSYTVELFLLNKLDSRSLTFKLVCDVLSLGLGVIINVAFFVSFKPEIGEQIRAQNSVDEYKDFLLIQKWILFEVAIFVANFITSAAITCCICCSIRSRTREQGASIH